MPTNQHPPIAYGKIGILLINLGTPKSPTTKEVRKFLAEFLSDPRIIPINPLIWQIILRGFILPFRSPKTTKAYQKIWDNKNNQSPLAVITAKQAHALQKKLNNKQFIVDWAMRYGNPNIANAIDKLKQKGCDKILFCPLYPQYSATTTASAHDASFTALQKYNWQGGFRFLPAYYDNPHYINAITKTIQQHPSFNKTHAVLLSFHGLPESSLKQGDPYYCHCHKTARLIRQKLNLGDDKTILAFQSRFGKAEWLKPYSDKIITQLPQQGIKNLIVACPGFAVDCLETLEEIGIALKQDFIRHGGENFDLIPCLNASPIGINMLSQIIKQELKGWNSKPL